MECFGHGIHFTSVHIIKMQPLIAIMSKMFDSMSSPLSLPLASFKDAHVPYIRQDVDKVWLSSRPDDIRVSRGRWVLGVHHGHD